MSFNRGGQKRTIDMPCGVRITGHPNEVDKKFIRHNKYCVNCKEIRGNSKIIIPEKFCKLSGEMNGWNGLRGDKLTQKIMTTTFIDGESYNIISKSHTIDNAVNNVKAIINLCVEKEK